MHFSDRLCNLLDKSTPCTHDCKLTLALYPVSCTKVYVWLAADRDFTKAETVLAESFNSLIRHYLAKFNRKKRYSKVLDMVYNSLLLLFNTNLSLSIFS